MEIEELLKYLSSLPSNKKRREAMIGRVLFSIDEIITEDGNDPFISRSLWERFRNILVETREATKNPRRKERLNKSIKKIEQNHLQ